MYVIVVGSPLADDSWTKHVLLKPDVHTQFSEDLVASTSTCYLGRAGLNFTENLYSLIDLAIGLLLSAQKMY